MNGARPVSFKRSLLERVMVDLELQMSQVEWALESNK